jgi:hypothetical protein
MNAIAIYNEIISNPAFSPLSLKNWVKLASEKGLFKGDIQALTDYYKVNHLDTDLEDIIEELKQKGLIEDASVMFEEDIREEFNDLVQEGAKEIAKGKHSFTKNI